MRYRDNSNKQPIYGSSESLFTCDIHHGGTVCMEHRKFSYIGGKKDYFDYVDPDEVSLLEFETMAEQLGYSKNFSVWCRVYGEKGINPKLIVSDQDLMVMIDRIPKKNRVIECFLDHRTEDENLQAQEVAEVVVGDVGDENQQAQEVEEVGVDDEPDLNKNEAVEAGEDDVSDFYDPNNDVEADDDDVATSRNMVYDTTTLEWIAPHKSLTVAEVNDDDSDYAQSDILLSAGESDDDLTSLRYPEFNAAVDMANPQFKVGMVFGSFTEFKNTVKEYAIRQRRNVHFEKNDTMRVKAVCKKGCPWNIWASHMGDGTDNVQVKTYNHSHTCSNEHNIKFLTVKWLVKKYLETFRADPNWSLSGIQVRIRDDFHLGITRQKAYNVRTNALKIIAGNEGEQYAKLNSYAGEIRRTNPGSTVIYDLRNRVLKKAYICLQAYKKGFLAGCRRIISLDGCFLKGRYGGELLSAVGIDANGCIFPIAYAVVEGETSESWRWFLQLLSNDLSIDNSHAWTFMSDRQKGLVPTLKSLFPASEFRFCVRHLYDNYLNAGHRGKSLKDALWSVAMATYVPEYEQKMKELEVLNKAAYEWLKKKPPTEWSKSHFSTKSKSDMLLNNLCESFNKYILDARDKHIITMFEMIRTKLMRRFQVKRDEMMKYKGPICPKIQKKLDNWKEESIKYNAIWNGESKYQVTGFHGQFVVNISTSSCDCRKWDLTGIPCEHACASMRVNGLQPEDYVNNCYKVETYLKIYNYAINPTSGEAMWEKNALPLILPPHTAPPKPGRPKKARRKSNAELENNSNRTKLSKKGRTVSCSICHHVGHNKRWHATQPTPSARQPTSAAKNYTPSQLGTNLTPSENATPSASAAAESSTRKKLKVTRKR